MKSLTISKFSITNELHINKIRVATIAVATLQLVEKLVFRKLGGFRERKLNAVFFER